MKKTIIAALFAGVSFLFASNAVMAQEVQFTGKKCPLTIITDIAADAENVTAETSSLSGFNALGRVNDLYVAVAYEGNKTGYVLAQELQEKVPALNLDALNSVSGWTDLGQGSGGDRTAEVQQALSDLKLLEGGVDGAYGNGTASSVKAFQKEAGLPQTGTVDAAAYFLLMDAAAAISGSETVSSGSAEPLVTEYPPVYKPEDKFAAIYQDVEDPQILKPFLDPVWKFQYDVFEGTGRIDYTDEGIYLGSIRTGDRFIDRLDLEGDVHIEVQRGEKNVVSLFPVIEIDTLGSYRPYIQGAALKRGMTVIDLECVYTEGGLNGIDSTEKAWLLLSEDMLKIVSAEETENELILRIHGLHQDYDMDISEWLGQIQSFVVSYTDLDDGVSMDGPTEFVEDGTGDTALNEANDGTGAGLLGISGGTGEETDGEVAGDEFSEDTLSDETSSVETGDAFTADTATDESGDVFAEEAAGDGAEEEPSDEAVEMAEEETELLF